VYYFGHTMVGSAPCLKDIKHLERLPNSHPCGLLRAPRPCTVGDVLEA
jgi:hypothetical protein